MHRVHNLFPDDYRHPRATYCNLGSLSFSWGTTFPSMLSRCCFDPPSFSTFYIVNKARNQAMMERDIEYPGMKSRGYTTFHYLSSISHRIVFYRPLLRIFPSTPTERVFALLFHESRKFLKVQVREIFTYYLYVIIARIDIFWKCNARYGEKYVLRWWYTLLWISYISFRL